MEPRPAQIASPAPVTRVLIVDDEPAVAATVAAVFAADGYQPEVVASLEHARLALEQDYAMVVLDLILPDGSGFELLEIVKAPHRRPTPALVLSAMARQETKLRAFELGADEYVVKPFHAEELAARAQAVLRRYSPQGDLSFGPYVLDLAGRKLLREGEHIHLRPKEFDLLAMLARHPGEALAQERLVREVWGAKQPAAGRQAVAVAIHSLREKLEPDQQHPRYIRTVPRFGYRFEPGG